eukprot:403357608
MSLSLDEALNRVHGSDAFRKIQNLYPNFSFEEEIKQNIEVSEYIRNACLSNVAMIEDPKTKSDAPKLNEDFSKYFVINNLPICDAEKSKKLIQLIIKLYQKKEISFTENDITMPLDANGNTQGVAFFVAASEEKAKLAAAIMNDYQFDKKHLLSASQINDFEKIMQTRDLQEGPRTSSLIDLRDPILDTKREQYLFQTGKEVNLKWHDGTVGATDSNVAAANLQSDRPVQWSPKGTYLIVIKHDKVEFHGGKHMQPIITIPEPKVENVNMSPCERYVLTYAPTQKSPYVVWDFQLVEQIRDFDQKRGESFTTYQWSFDGNYLAKKFEQEIKKEGQEEAEKTKKGLSVYKLPTMELIENAEGLKKSITIEGIEDWQWAPHRNFIVYSAFPPEENQFPRIGFLEIPSRKPTIKTFAAARAFKLYFHPQGDYLAIMNEYQQKKTIKYSVELFDTKKNSFPHQQILVNRDVIEFNGVIWEPFHSKMAIHTLSKRVVEAGKKDYTLDAKRNGVDIYEMIDDQIKGFVTKTIGYLPSEKVVKFSFSGSGDIFTVYEQEARMATVSFYMIMKQQPDTANAVGGPVKKSGPSQVNKLSSAEEKFEFKKTAKQDIYETKFEEVWDQTGRYLAIYGIKRSPLDKTEKSVKFYNIFGDLLSQHEGLQNLQQFKWRPRPTGTLKPKEVQKIKSEYKTKYLKKFKEEEKSQKKATTSVEKEQRKQIRDEFLNNFFLPLRKEFEDNISEYEKLWPIKDKDMAATEVELEIIYAYDNVISERKIN